MARIQRRRRARCRLRCEVLEGRRRSTEASILSLSEGGLSLELDRAVEQGEGLRLRITARAGAAGLVVDAIVWNQRVVAHTRRAPKRYVLGCVVSDPSRDFLRLLERLEQRDGPPRARGIVVPPKRAAAAPAAMSEPETDLPRSHAPMPPPKPEPEETLPRFRVRLKQVGGPRSRNVSVRAHSLADAEARARAEIGANGDWQILDVVPG